MEPRAAPGRAIVAITTLVVVAAVLPILVASIGGVVDAKTLGIVSEQWVRGGRGVITGKYIAYVVDTYAPTLWFSLRLAVLAACGCLVIGVPGAYALARWPSPVARVIEEIVLAPLALPGIALSVALIQSYAPIRGRWELILGGHLLYTLPLMVRVVTSALRSAELERLEQAARSLGASLATRLRLVVLPGIRHAIVTGSLLVVAVSWGEFNISYLLTTPLHQTFPAALYATYTFNSFQVSSAATLVFLAGLLPLVIALQWLGGGRETIPAQGA